MEQHRKDSLLENELFSLISHEIKTPITIIRGFAEILEGSTVDPSMQEKIAKAILGACGKMERLFFHLEKIFSYGKIEASFSSIAVQPLLEKIYLKAKNKYPCAEITLVNRVNNRLHTIWAEPFLLEIAIMNLIDNAIHFSDEKKCVTLVMRASAKSYMLSVEDRGIGISSSFQNKVFQPFFSAHPKRSKEKGGSGLGLYLVQRILQQHQASLELVSKKGKGSCFTITLPLEKQ